MTPTKTPIGLDVIIVFGDGFVGNASQDGFLRLSWNPQWSPLKPFGPFLPNFDRIRILTGRATAKHLAKGYKNELQR